MATQVNDPDGQVYLNLLYLIATTIDIPWSDRPSESNSVTRVAMRFFDENLQPTTGVFPVRRRH